MKIWLPKIAVGVKDDELWGCLYGENPVFPQDYTAEDYICVVVTNEKKEEENGKEEN